MPVVRRTEATEKGHWIPQLFVSNQVQDTD
jgi:hypothetical protein